MNAVDVQDRATWIAVLVVVGILAAYGIYTLFTGRLRREANGRRFPLLTIALLIAAVVFVKTVILPHLGIH